MWFWAHGIVLAHGIEKGAHGIEKGKTYIKRRNLLCKLAVWVQDV